MVNPEPASAQALFQEGAAHHAAGRLGPAITAYRRAIAAQPDFAGAYCNLGIALAHGGQVNDALIAYQKAIELAPEAAVGHYNLALLQHGAGRYAEAEASLRLALSSEPGLAAGHSALANTLQAVGRLEEAAASVHAALTLRPDHVGDLLNLAQVLEKLGRQDEALAATERALNARPDAVSVLATGARLLKALGRAEDAVRTARRAVALGPLDLEALRALHAALRDQDGGAEVETAYAAALDQQPQLADVACDLAELRLARHDPEAALAACEACLRANPGQTRTLSLKTVALNELGEDRQLARLTSVDLRVHRRRWREAPGGRDLAALNDELSAHILAHPSLYREPRETTTRLGRHSGELLIEPKGPIAILEQMICQAVEDYQAEQRSNPFVSPPAPIPERWSLNVWAVVLEAAGYQEPHIHPSAWLSGVYYAALPEPVADGGKQGWLEFGRPLDNHHVTKPAPTTTIEPERGLMVLFPSYFFHRTIPFDSPGTRISIAFDVIPETGRA